MDKEKSCGAVIYRKNNNQIYYLLICSKQGHHWSYPKGHVENEETEEQTAKREIWEETGLKPVLDLDFRMVITYSPKPGIMKDVVYFVGELVDNQTVEIQTSEVLNYQWLPFEDALSTVTHDNEKNILMGANKYLTKKGVI